MKSSSSRASAWLGYVLVAGVAGLSTVASSGAEVLSGYSQYVAEGLTKAKDMPTLSVELDISGFDRERVVVDCFLGAFDDEDGDGEFDPRRGFRGKVGVTARTIDETGDEGEESLFEAKVRTKSDGFFLVTLRPWEQLTRAPELTEGLYLKLTVESRRGKAQAISAGCEGRVVVP